MKKLSINEQIFLIAIWHLKDQAYGVNIRKKIAQLTGISLLFGTLYNTLDYLAQKGYVETQKGEPTNQRGGHNKIYYRITAEGLEAMQKAHELQDSLWQGIPRFVVEGK
jgi:PadR family transcriptional regulator PadR